MRRLKQHHQRSRVRAIAGRIRRGLVQAHRDWVFRRAVESLQRDVAGSVRPSRDLLARLHYGWGNEGWSAGTEYLSGCIALAQKAEAPILECGSGLSTIVLAIIARQRGVALWTLEHSAQWGEMVRSRLASFGLASAQLCIEPLARYAGFDWYAPPLHAMPRDFGLVICDGPPGDTRGGRSGLLPVMRDRLKRGAVILLDDASRAPEQSIARQWAQELRCGYEVLGAEKPFIRMVVGPSDPVLA